MTIAFTQNEIETQLSDAVPRIKRRDIARLTGIYESVIYGYFNADDPRKSPQFETLLIQAAIDEMDPDTGDDHWAAMCDMREISRPKRPAGLSLASEAAANHKESFDVVDAVIRGQSLYDQLDEVNQQIRQAEKHKLAIIEAINHEKESPNGGRTRFNARQFAKDAVGKRR